MAAMAVEREAGASVCAGCGVRFVCGAAAGLPTCWCMERPRAAFAPDAAALCYCPACLDKRISEQSSPAT
jgi:hypothetical protein